MKRALSLLAQSLAVQAAVKQVAEARLPVGTGPISASLLTGVDFQALAAPPAFLSQLQMPQYTPEQLAHFRPATSSIRASSALLTAARGEVHKSLSGQIRASGLMGSIAAASRKKYNETYLADTFAYGVMMSFDPTTKRPVGRRLLGWWDDVWDAVTGAAEDLGCGAFATGAVPGYLAAYGLFHGGNSGYSKLNGQQKFFQRAGGFSTDLLNTVNVKYGAWFAPGFGSASAVTMGKEIYVRGAAATADTLPTWNMTITPSFIAQTRLLMHEMGHSKQYAARSWNIATFGWDYLFNYCKAGFSYEKNSMEVDAETYRDNSDGIMLPLASAHFKKWRKSNLESTVGYSKSAAEYTNFKIGTTSVMSLDLVKVSTKTGESQRKGGSVCVRVLSGSALSSRTQADIPGFPWDCVNAKPTSAPTRKPTTRAPTAPTPKPTFGIAWDGQIPQLSPTFKPVP